MKNVQQRSGLRSSQPWVGIFPISARPSKVNKPNCAKLFWSLLFCCCAWPQSGRRSRPRRSHKVGSKLSTKKTMYFYCNHYCIREPTTSYCLFFRISWSPGAMGPWLHPSTRPWNMHWVGWLSLLLLCARPKSVCLRFEASVPNNLCVVKNLQAPDNAARNGPKFQLLPRNCCSMESRLLKRSFCEQFHLLCDTRENFRLSEILGPRVRILVSACRFAGFDFLTVWSFVTDFIVGVLLSFQRWNFSERVPLCWMWSKIVKMTRYDGPGWILNETRFSLCLKTQQSLEVAVSGNGSPLFKFDLPGPKSFW